MNTPANDYSVYTHTNLIWSLGNYKRGQLALKTRFRKQIRVVCSLNKHSNGETVWNARQQVECYRATATLFIMHFSTAQKCFWQDISRTGPSSTHTHTHTRTHTHTHTHTHTQRTMLLKKKNPGDWKTGEKNVRFLSHSIRQRSQICLEWSQASRTECFLERRAENGAPWQQQKSLQLYLQFLQWWKKGK